MNDTAQALSAALDRIFQNDLGAYYIESSFGEKTDVKNAALEKFARLQIWGVEREFGLVGDLTFQAITDLDEFLKTLERISFVKIKNMLKSADESAKKRNPEAQKRLSGIIFPVLFSLKKNIAIYARRTSDVRKKWDRDRKRPKRDYEKSLGWLEKGRHILTEDEYNSLKDRIKARYIKEAGQLKEDKELYEEMKGKEKGELNWLVLTTHYLLEKHAGYAPTGKAASTTAFLLNSIGIKTDAETEYDRNHINATVQAHRGKEGYKHLEWLLRL